MAPDSKRESYVNFVHNLTSYDAIAKSGQLGAEGWTDDATDVINEYSYNNTGWYQRFLWFFNDSGDHPQPLNQPKVFVSKLSHPLAK